MHIQFEKNTINKDLPGIILLSHGGLALGMLDTITLIMGKSENIAVLTLDEQDDPEYFRAAFLEIVEAYPSGAAIFIDMFGGSPCNQLLMSARCIKNNFCAISGMNLPLVSEAITMRSICKGDALAKAILSVAQDSIVDLEPVIDRLESDK